MYEEHCTILHNHSADRVSKLAIMIIIAQSNCTRAD